MMRQPWTDGLLAGFDLETTGTDPTEARIVTASVVLAGRHLGVVERSWLVDPGVEIPAEATAIHGITTEQARREGLPAMEAVPAIAGLAAELWRTGIPVVIYNAAYDLTVLDRELRRQGLPGLEVGGR